VFICSYRHLKISATKYWSYQQYHLTLMHVIRYRYPQVVRRPMFQYSDPNESVFVSILMCDMLLQFVVGCNSYLFLSITIVYRFIFWPYFQEIFCTNIFNISSKICALKACTLCRCYLIIACNFTLLIWINF
jgi:hypothetical protein